MAVTENNSTTMTVGQRFRSVREHYRYSGAAFGELLGINQEKISRIERDKVIIGHDVVLSLMQQFGISADWLISGKGPRYKLVDKNTLVTDVNLLGENIEVIHAVQKKQGELIDQLFKRLNGHTANISGVKLDSKKANS